MPSLTPSLKDYKNNPELAQFQALSSIAQSFAQLSDQPFQPIEERLKTFLFDKGVAQFKELLGIAQALAYEQLVARNQAQNNINVCEEELAKRAQSKTEVEEEVEEEPKEATE